MIWLSKSLYCVSNKKKSGLHVIDKKAASSHGKKIVYNIVEIQLFSSNLIDHLPISTPISDAKDNQNGKAPFVCLLHEITSPSQSLYYCAGAIVASDWIITSAQCLEGYVNFFAVHSLFFKFDFKSTGRLQLISK